MHRKADRSPGFGQKLIKEMAEFKIEFENVGAKDQIKDVGFEANGGVRNEEIVNCNNCNWMGKMNAFIKHLREKLICGSKYDMQIVLAEQDQPKKNRKQHYNKMQYAKKVQQKKTYYQDKKEERLAYQSRYYKDNKDTKLDHQKKYYVDNKEQRLEYQCNYDEKHEKENIAG